MGIVIFSNFVINSFVIILIIVLLYNLKDLIDCKWVIVLFGCF